MTDETDKTGEGDPQPARRNTRRSVSLDGHAVRADGSAFDISMLDLNYDGCGISAPVELTPGEPLKLSMIGRGMIDAEVRWCKDGKAGLRFATGEPPVEQQTPRSQNRKPLEPIEVRIRRLGQFNYNVRIFDLSPDGAKIEVVERPRIGETIMVKFDGLEVLPATVRWIDDFIVGIKFNRPLHPAVLDLLLARLAA